MNNIIKNHRAFVANQIEKSFDSWLERIDAKDALGAESK